MPTFRDRGVVLRSYKLGETDRIVHLFLQEHGKVRAVAKGVRRPGSRFGARLEPYSYVDVQLFLGRSSLAIVQQVELIDSHRQIRTEFATSVAASVIAEFVDVTSLDNEKDVSLLSLTRAVLMALDVNPEQPAVFLDAFLLRGAAVLGFQVTTAGCARCSHPGQHAFLSVRHGGLLCADCAPSGARAVDWAVVETLGLLQASGQWRELPQLLTGDVEAYKTAASYVRAFVEHHLDRRLKGYDTVPRP
jgi:DNA repair protein RecO (recombination protein O)